MIDPTLLDKANAILERLFALDEAVANARAFCSFLEDLHGRDLSGVQEPHVSSIKIARAGILRSAIGAIMACLDRSDRRGNRASVGQILDMLSDPEVAVVLPEDRAKVAALDVALEQVQADYDALLKGDMLQRGRRLREDAIAHILIRDDPIPDLTYETIYDLCDSAEKFVTRLYEVCYRGQPQFLMHKAGSMESAKVFWDTHFVGMRSI